MTYDKYWIAKKTERDGNTVGKSKFPKIVRNISLNIDQQIFSHTQSQDYSQSPDVAFCNKSSYNKGSSRDAPEMGIETY